MFSFSGLKAAHAATSPTLVGAKNYSILGGSAITNTGASSATGDVGVSPGTSIGGGITGGTQHSNDASAIAAQTDATNAYTSLGQTCDFGPVGPTDLAGAVLTPGVYCYSSSVQISVGGVLHLDALGNPNAVWIFKTGSTLTTISGASVVFDNVGSACNVWWQIGSSATLGTTTSFIGNIIAAHDITLLTGATVNGRILARGVSADGTVALDTNTISGPTCPVPQGGGIAQEGTINVVKTVINDNGGTKVVTDFPLFVNGSLVYSGTTNSFYTNGNTMYTVTETSDSHYTRTFSGDCDINGNVILGPNENKFCIVTNNDIGAPAVPPVPPLIDVVKVPSPLALPGGPGPVTYTYTLKNVGTIPVTNITMVGDTCSPINLVSGDENFDSKLQVNETWVYKCTTNLLATHTNTVVATGWANGLSAVDIASATVIVGAPVVPPLIHVTKIPSPLALFAAGGLVTYTERITNPGTVALSNVRIADDKCSPVNYISGDLNNDLKLDTNEAWVYTCRANLTQTTTNTANVAGDANGLTARDFAIATVVVAAPGLPNTGLPPESTTMLVGALLLVSAAAVIVLKKRKNLV